jgi:cell fate regulator YaaT (PSP1 superfamily)
MGAHYVPDHSIVPPLRPVIRTATEADLRVSALNKEREKEAFEICREKIAEHGLEMKLVNVECGFDGNKMLFFFTADGRVDFRDLVKDLASVFRTRIELRQIGVRDETKMLGGMGICGRPYCCSQFLSDFRPVSTKMAKIQSMSLNPTKISGSCGRLMCCLRYEQDAYEDLIRNIPKIGAFVQTSKGYGNVVQTNVLRQKVKIRLDNEGEGELEVLDASEIAAVPGGRPRQGEPLPNVLNNIEKEEKDEDPEKDIWEAPSLFAEDPGAPPHREEDSEKSLTADNSRNNGDLKKRQVHRPKPMGGGAKKRPQLVSGTKRTDLPSAKAPDAASNTQKPRPDGSPAGKPKAKQQNANRNKKRYYSKPKPASDGKNPS